MVPAQGLAQPQRSVDAGAEERSDAQEVPLHRNANGTYTYSGRGFDATIESNGSVRMRDRVARPRLGLFPRQAPTGEWYIDFFQVRSDILGWVDKQFGNDPYRTERIYFLRGTQELRERLAVGALEKVIRRALHGIWSRPGLTFAARRRETFQLWDGSTEDEFGQVGRAAVLEFVREKCPRDSALAYTPDELRSFNASRRSRAAFSPYPEVSSPAEQPK